MVDRAPRAHLMPEMRPCTTRRRRQAPSSDRPARDGRLAVAVQTLAISGLGARRSPLSGRTCARPEMLLVRALVNMSFPVPAKYEWE